MLPTLLQSELVAGADHMSTHGLLGWEGLDEGRMRRPTPRCEGEVWQKVWGC